MATLPLRSQVVGEGEHGAICEIKDAHNSTIAEYVHDEDAEFIVRACNAHDDLLQACYMALSHIQSELDAGLDMYAEVQQLEDAINKATKEQPSAESN